MDSRLRRFPPNRASAVPYGQTVENALRFPPLAHRSAAAHKLHSAHPITFKIRESQNHHPTIDLSLFHPGGCPSYRNHRTEIKVPVTIIGDGPLRADLLALSRQLNLVDDIQWFGAQPHSAFIAELYKADIFLSPSVTAEDGDTEGGAPVSIIEAGASGLAVVSTTHADIPEVVLTGKTGILVPERDVNSLVQAILSFIDEPISISLMGYNAREHIFTYFDAIRQGKRLEDIYASVTARNRIS